MRLSVSVLFAMFDYLIIGGGAAGCVLAYRLSENPNIRVGVIEYGSAGNHKRTIVKTPLGMVAFMMPNLAFLGGPKMTYMYKGQPNQGLSGASLDLPRGKAVGGSSMLNGMVYIRGQHEDFDHWETLGATGWGRDEMLRYFKKAEHFEIAEDPECTPGFQLDGRLVKDQIDYSYHSTGGPYNVAPPRSPNPIGAVYMQAAKEAGYRLNPDFNGAQHEGIGYHWMQQKGGERWGMESAYANPCKARPNVEFITEAKVKRILLDGKKAVGVAFQQDGIDRVEHVRREVILSAGAFNSPQILMLNCPSRPAGLVLSQPPETRHSSLAAPPSSYPVRSATATVKPTRRQKPLKIPRKRRFSRPFGYCQPNASP